MKPVTYRVRIKGGQQFHIRCDLADGNAPIWATWFDPADKDEWAPTPFRSADVERSEWKAAVLIAEHFAEPGESMDVESVEAMEPDYEEADDDEDEEEEEHKDDGERSDEGDDVRGGAIVGQ
jgi:hypothetical protein